MIPYFPVTSGNSDHNYLIECYFNTSNLEYLEILLFLLLVHGIQLSICQLKRYFFQKGYVGEEIIASLGFLSSLSF